MGYALFTLYFAATLLIILEKQFWLFGASNCICDSVKKLEQWGYVEFTVKPSAPDMYTLLSSVMGGKRKLDTYIFAEF
jgi:hypothetical protein